MSDWTRMVAVVGIFVTGAFANYASGTILANLECTQGVCGTVSQTCSGTGSCTYCDGASNILTCKVVIGKTCDSTGGLAVCGNEWSGSCMSGTCTGTTYVDASCEKQRCRPTPGTP